MTFANPVGIVGGFRAHWGLGIEDYGLDHDFENLLRNVGLRIVDYLITP